MEVRFPPKLQKKLDWVAARQGRKAESLVCEAVELLVASDERFLREVDEGLAAAERGELIDHDEIGRMIENRYRA